MGAAYTGALIVIEQDMILEEYEKTGIAVDGIVTSQLLVNIFEHNTPLHDGAVIIRGDRVVAATCYLPLSDNNNLNKALGTRHRAGVGISEVTDSMTIIVSEETGKVSVAVGGELIHDIDADSLRNKLEYLRRRTIDVKSFRIWRGRLKHEGKMFKNLSLKILSAIFAVVLWTIIVNIYDPTTSYTFSNVTVQLINTESLTDKNYSYEIVEGGKISVYVSDRRVLLLILRQVIL